MAYCLMPNHIHFLIKTHCEIALEVHPKYKLNFHKLIMQEISNLLNANAKAYNIKYNRKGALWIYYTKRFKVDSESYLASVINYIHQNSVKHGFIGSAGGWQYSSFNAILSEKPTLIKRDEVIRWFGSKDNYLNFHLKETGSLNNDWEY
jgi:putative transposase